MYKFKSPAAADLIMLEPNGRQILKIIGKDNADSVHQGILLPAQMPAAIVALQAAVAQEEALREQATQDALARGEPVPRFEGVSLRQRVTPLVAVLQRCIKADQEMVWGV